VPKSALELRGCFKGNRGSRPENLVYIFGVPHKGEDGSCDFVHRTYERTTIGRDGCGLDPDGDDALECRLDRL